jgi:hypothetical protein
MVDSFVSFEMTREFEGNHAPGRGDMAIKIRHVTGMLS